MHYISRLFETKSSLVINKQLIQIILIVIQPTSYIHITIDIFMLLTGLIHFIYFTYF